MLVRAPITYSARIRRPRKRNDEDAVYRDHVAVEVAEVSPADAPVVIRETRWDYRKVPEHRHHDGALWMPHDASYDSRDVAPRPRSALEGDGTRHMLHASNAVDWRADKAEAFDREAVRDVWSSDRDEVIAKVRAHVRDLLIVGDEVWRRAAEPVFKVNRPSSGSYVTVDAFEVGDRDQFRLDQGHWIHEVEGRYERRVLDRSIPDVDVVRPDLLRARTTDHAVAYSGRHLVDVLAKELKEAALDDMAVYVDVRDALRAFEGALARDAETDLAGFGDRLAEGLEVLERLSEFGGRFEREWVGRARARIALATGHDPEATLSTLTL